MRRGTGEAMEIADLHDAARPARTQQLDARVECGQCDGHVGGKGRNAGFARAENRMNAVDAADRRAAGAGLALVARRRRVVEVRTARALNQVSADGRLVAQLTRSTGDDRFGQHRIAAAHAPIARRLGIGNLSADAQSAVRQLIDTAKRQPADIDQMGRTLDLELHEIEQVRSAADETRARPAADHGGNGGFRVRRTLVCERAHAPPPRATLRIAATMFG